MRDLRTIILAAGKGTRMNSDIPKVLHTVCGKPIIQYVLDRVQAVGSLKTYVILGHQSNVVQAHLPKDVLVLNQIKLLGTADAVKHAEKYLKSYLGDVLILCGDTPLLNKSVIKSLIRRHRKTNAFCTFLTAVVHDPHGYGRIIRDEKGSVVAIREDKEAIGFERNIAEINVGVYCFKCRELFTWLKEVKSNQRNSEFYLTDIIELFTENGLKVETIETEDPSEGLGINTREDLASAEAILRLRTLKEMMVQGVTIIDPKTTYIDSEVKIGKDTIIRPFTFIENDVRIGNRCVIGPFSRLRQGTRIGHGVEVGNFTEVVRSKIGDKTLMKHFSYLGDVSVGTNVNIGAGTVVANFDGKEKHPSKISDYAFIGSDSVLIAPFKIGKKAVIGAGSVVTKGKNIPDGRLAFGVPARVISKEENK